MELFNQQLQIKHLFSFRNYARKPLLNPEDDPVKFSSSGAIYGLAHIKQAKLDTMPWYQGLVCSFSVAVFLIYFCILREENDIDLEFDKTLNDRVEGVEVTSLKVARNFYVRENNMSEVKKIDVRLKELGVALT